MTRIQLRHDTATNWTTANPILAEGEVGVETDTNKFKIGDGVTAWNSLDYQGGGGDLSNYYTKTETNSLLANKEDVITPIAPLNIEDVNIKSTATSTADDGETFTTPNTTEYPYKFDNAGTGLANFQVQTTASGNGIIDRTKNIVCDIKPDEDIEYVWTNGTVNGNSPVWPIFVLGNMDSDGYFTPVIISNSNFAWTNPYNMYFYVRNFTVNSIGASTTYDWQVGTAYNGNYGDIGYVSISGIANVPTAKESKLRCYKDSNGKLVLYFQVTDSDNNTGSGTFTTGLDFDEVNINCILFHSSSTSTYTGNQFGVFNITSGEQIWNPAEDNFQNQLSLSIGDGLLVDNNTLKTNSYSKSETYTKTETNTLLADKMDNTGTQNPLEIATVTDSTIVFDDWAGGTSTYNYDTGEYSHTFNANSLQFTILVDIPDDINIDVYSDYWRISDGSCKMVLNQPYWGSANALLMFIRGDDGTDLVEVSRLWYGSSAYRAGTSTNSTSQPFRDCIAVHTANSTRVNDGNGQDIANGLSANIRQGVRLKRLQFNCACQVSSSWAYYSSNWGYYWTDSTGAKLKTIKLYTSPEDTVGTELIVTVTQPKIMLNTNNSLTVQNNLLGVNTSQYYTQTQTDTMLGNKADTDLDNVSTNLSNDFLDKLMPDWNNTINITSSFPYTCPSSGYLYLRNYNGFIEIDSSLNTLTHGYKIAGTSDASNTGMYPVQLNEILTLNSTRGTSNMYFIPLKGAN